MARQIISRKDLSKMRSQDQVPDPQTDGQESRSTAAGADIYVDRLLKYIPAEVVAIYILVQGLVLQMDQNTVSFKPILWGVFSLFSILTPLYLWRIQKVSKITQLTISMLAFVVWVFALGGPFTTLGWYDPIYGEIFLPIFTLIVALVVAEK